MKNLLIKSGFSEDMFYIRIEWNKVIIMFDLKEAVDYFEEDFLYDEISKKYEYSYKEDGKRHCAIIKKIVR